MRISDNLLWMLLGSNYMLTIIIEGFVWGTLRYACMLGIFILISFLIVKYCSHNTRKVKV